MQHGQVSQKTHVTWRLPSLSTGSFAAAYIKDMSRDSYPVLWWRHCTCMEVCLPSLCLGIGCIIPLFYCCMLDRIYGAVAWQFVTIYEYIYTFAVCFAQACYHFRPLLFIALTKDDSFEICSLYPVRNNCWRLTYPLINSRSYLGRKNKLTSGLNPAQSHLQK
jgi:hypothetical protein